MCTRKNNFNQKRVLERTFTLKGIYLQNIALKNISTRICTKEFMYQKRIILSICLLKKNSIEFSRRIQLERISTMEYIYQKRQFILEKENNRRMILSQKNILNRKSSQEKNNYTSNYFHQKRLCPLDKNTSTEKEYMGRLCTKRVLKKKISTRKRPYH